MSFLFNCKQSEFLSKRYSYFNFIDEGFLSPSLLQTIGSAKFYSEKWISTKNKQMCLDLAQRDARRRLLRIILHLYLRIPSKISSRISPRISTKNISNNKTRAIQLSKDDLSSSYPVHFTNTNIVRAELAFREFIGRGFIVLADSREVKKCRVVYRVKGDKNKHGANLIHELKNMKIDLVLYKTEDINEDNIY